MRRLALASAALSALVMSFGATASEASPPTPGPRGRVCSYSASSDPAPDADADAMTGQVNGGPMVWDRPYWLHCHIQVDNDTHTGPVAPGGDVHGPSDPHDNDGEEDEVAIVASQVVYESPEDAQDYLCTSVSWPNVDGPNWLYWHPTDDQGTPDPGDDEPGHWTPTNTKPCGAATQASTGPVIDAINDVIIEDVDPTLCYALQSQHTGPPGAGDPYHVDGEGDVFIDDGDGYNEAGVPGHEDDWRDDMWWDCPEYADWESDPPAPGADGADGGVYDSGSVFDAPGADADAEGLSASAGEYEAAHVQLASDVAESDTTHDHFATGSCDYTRTNRTATITGRATLRHHVGHRHTQVKCELWNRWGNLVLSSTATQDGGTGYVSATGRVNTKKNTVCVTVTGFWTDNHARTFGPTCRSVN